MVQIPDKYKLVLLSSALTGCTLTYFLPGASRNLASIKNISPPIDKYCHKLQEKYRGDCKKKDETDLQCIELREDLEDCKSAIVSAYKHVNMKCLKYSVQMQLCVSDCGGNYSSEDSEDVKNESDCYNICKGEAGRLNECEKGVVAKELKAYGIQDIVSMNE